MDPVSEDYDYGLLQDRLAQLRLARESGDLASMIFLLRTSLSRNLGDMGNPKVTHYKIVSRYRYRDLTIAPFLALQELPCWYKATHRRLHQRSYNAAQFDM
jgi:hypothetical protein